MRDSADGESPERTRPFVIWCNGVRNTFDANNIGKLSKKAADLIATGRYFAILPRTLRSETLTAFVNACKPEPFDVTPEIAHELRELAVEWRVPDLEELVGQFFSEYSVPPPPAIDPISALLNSIRDGVDDPALIPPVANIASAALQDARLLSAPPEVLFQIVLAAAARSGADELNGDLLVGFVMRLFEANPLAAVPLVLLIDYDRLTEEQRDLLFHCPEMHEENVGFFASQAISAARNKAERELELQESEFHAELHSLKASLKDDEDQEIAPVRAEVTDRIAQLRSDLARQQGQIHTLRASGAAERQKIDSAIEANSAAFADFAAQLERLDDHTKQQAAQAEEENRRISAAMAEQIQTISRSLDEKIAGINKQDADGRETAAARFRAEIDEQQARLRQLRQVNTQLAEDLSAAGKQMLELKSTLAAKIVRDRLRFDRFLRQTDCRFETFAQPDGLWDLTPENVRQAEQFILDIEAKLDQLCPIRGNQPQPR
jgi:hypothetical protein